MEFLYRCQETGKWALSWLLANGQTCRWVTEKVVIGQILASDEFRPFLYKCSQGSAVDIGCAGGRYLIDLLAPRFSAVTGLEYRQIHVDLAATRVARAGLSDRIRIRQGDAERLPLGDGSTDFVLCTQVLEHLRDPARGVAEIGRILRPSGRAILSIPIPPDPLSNPEHLHKDFFPSRLDQMIGDAGLKILERDYCMYVISRAVAWAVGTIRLPLPLNPLCWFEQATSKLFAWPNPHVYVCALEKV